MTGGPAMAVRVRIEGRVQGVWYRGWTCKMAGNLGLSGWVRNRPDGSVEALFSGPSEIVVQMVEACHHGPPAARVDNVTSSPESASPEPGFHQRQTA